MKKSKKSTRNLRAQVKALEALTGVSELSAIESSSVNGGAMRRAPTGKGPFAPIGGTTGPCSPFPSSGFIRVKGTGSIICKGLGA
jgi:hypothetical protein